MDNKALDEFFCVPVFEYDEYLGHIAYGDDQIVDRLNEVHEINGRCNREITLNHQKILKLMNENGQLKQDLGEYCDFSLHDVLDKKNKKIERLQSTLAYRSNQLALMEQLINDLGHEEMKRQMEEILND